MADPKERVRGSDPFAKRGTPSLLELTDSMIETEPTVVEREVPVPMSIVFDETTNVVWVGKFGLSQTGMFIDGEVSEGEWLDFYVAIQRLKDSAQWILGDWLAMGAYNWHKTYEWMAQVTGLKPETVESYASVCRNVPQLIRINSLSFSHHRLIAAMPEEAQIMWLNRAVEGRWSLSQMSDAINNAPTLPKGKDTISRFQRAFFPFQKRINNALRKAGESERRQVANELRQLADRIEGGK